MSKKYEKDSLGTRMKQYEAVPKNFLTLGCPKIIRLDMRAGHTFCRKFARPFDDVFSYAMIEASKKLCEEIPGVVCAYTQSDEISLIINDITDRGRFNCFFNGNVEKMVSITASKCTLRFQQAYMEIVNQMDDPNCIYKNNFWKGEFDSRVFCLPNVMEVHNYLLWRQQDATRNSIQMAGHAYFSDKELDKKNTHDIQDMLMLQKGINWSNYPVKYKRGAIILKEQYEKDVCLPNGNVITGVKRTRWVEMDIPILTTDLTFVPKVYNRALLVDGKLEEG
ncbi:MAG: tRNA(His) guanylyltransferase Thg1 family protein [Clostridiales bacterium]|nr:tRNA(His) guanylyltransferase Thg1 family protein [Clostridiales bacterium]